MSHWCQNFFSMTLTLRQNKLECFTLASFFAIWVQPYNIFFEKAYSPFFKVDRFIIVNYFLSTLKWRHDIQHNDTQQEEHCYAYDYLCWLVIAKMFSGLWALDILL